ncbi:MULTISPECIES: EF-hand domain-containing protein [Pseudoalteromonas]|uniref:Calcium-binding protein n=1 Tax=Pseudoalteromonas fuliginea TaxID=1872678 RepID=A0A063KMH6_9GAMM|nr:MULTISPECIES: calcium-binding protein [Pseudoalteromonas]ALQ07335.1 calcium-binding protein [Pseudoalteromonas sp. Bsw20308]ATG78440.1 calcium-binding protein [Pseudoalteromonas sp. 1_2015MBL_MicDiv]KAA1150578.1 EF-hand domain-containing protein [Pseudoalteromonas fuliginea]KAA1156845.1 EF-hand domain-containing protein [Pseudoalteromonas fuliginea]KAA1165317.1 EF-hand domain-containing protein [Pseudoalteromonas fuliginea]
MKKIRYMALFAFSTFCTLSFAASNNIVEQFNKFDRNQDGFLTRGEASIDPALWSRFSSYDQDKDGKLTLNEYGLYASK